MKLTVNITNVSLKQTTENLIKALELPTEPLKKKTLLHCNNMDEYLFFTHAIYYGQYYVVDMLSNSVRSILVRKLTESFLLYTDTVRLFRDELNPPLLYSVTRDTIVNIRKMHPTVCGDMKAKDERFIIPGF